MRSVAVASTVTLMVELAGQVVGVGVIDCGVGEAARTLLAARRRAGSSTICNSGPPLTTT